MKKLVTVFAGLSLLAACAEQAAEPTPEAPPAAEEQVSYAYTIEKPDQWEIGSKKNTEVALKALKAWETNDQAGGAAYWADSVHMSFDNFDAKLSKDSALASMFGYRNSVKNVNIKMHDWVATTSKDKETEYVSLWYTQVITNNDGSIDSLAVMDDIKLKDGKITEVDEKVRKLGPAKK